MIYKIKIKDKKTGEEDFVIMGDSYKSFREHFGDIVSHWTKKWHYASEDKYAECYGRTIIKEILEVRFSKDKFVSFGGLKMCYEENYDKKVGEHNKSGTYKPCKYLKDINWKLESKEFIEVLLKEKRVISEEELNNRRVAIPPIYKDKGILATFI